MHFLFRPLLTGPLLVAVAAAVLVVAPVAAHAARGPGDGAAPHAERVKTKPGAAPRYVIGRVRSRDGRVNIRSVPYTTGRRTGDVGNGDKVSLACGVVGDPVIGTVRTTRQWDKLANGYYISHAYLVTPTLRLCRDGAPARPAPPVAVNPARFIAAAVAGAQRGWREFGVPPSVTIAQAILESGWGRSDLAMVDRNFFGIKCFDGRWGRIANGCHTYPTSECNAKGDCFSTTASFRTYATPTHSFRDHGSFLRAGSRYDRAFAYTRRANLFIWNVWKAGYATDPNYFTKITGIMAANKLYQYDTWK